jgi:hypothetical protein
VQIFGGGFLHEHHWFGIIAIHSIYRRIKDQVLSCAFLFCPFLFWEIFVESKAKEMNFVIVYGLAYPAVLVSRYCARCCRRKGNC